MNKELEGVIYISRTHANRSHMWNGDTLLQYLEHLKGEIKRKRVALGLPFSAKALVLCDAATVHSTSIYQKIRERFEREANCIFVTGGNNSASSTSNKPLVIPGGWTATGAPNDGWHQWFHYLRRGFMKLAMGLSGSLVLRKTMAEFGVAVDGNSRFTWLGCVLGLLCFDVVW